MVIIKDRIYFKYFKNHNLGKDTRGLLVLCLQVLSYKGDENIYFKG